MERVCAVCGSSDGVQVVCHHCGIPLCNSKDCRYIVATDPAFIKLYSINHPWLIRLLTGLTKGVWHFFPWWLVGSNGLAYHCEECKNKYHSSFWQTYLNNLRRFFMLEV